MADAITIVPNTDVYGVSILIQLDAVTGSFTVKRVTPGATNIVRGLEDIVPVTDTMAMVDIETPLDLETYYVLEHTIPAFGVNTVSSTTLVTGWSTTTGFPKFVLRDLFRGLSGIVTDFTYGPIPDVDTTYRGGKFPVIGRPDPVIVIDTRASQQSSMILIAQNANAIKAIRLLVEAAHPLLIQTPPEYLLGAEAEGVMYLFPDKTSEQHIFPDGRTPTRRFVVDYTEISRPSSTVVFMPPGNTFDDVAGLYDTFDDLVAADISYVNLAYGPVFGYL